MKLRLRIHEGSALLAFSCCFVFTQEPPESIPALMFEAAKDPTMLILLAAAIVSLVCGVVPGVSMRSAGLRTVCSYARPTRACRSVIAASHWWAGKAHSGLLPLLASASLTSECTVRPPT